jgi:hypothetical protein
LYRPRVARARDFRIEALVNRFAGAVLLLVTFPAMSVAQADLGPWPQHSRERPAPRVVAPGAAALPLSAPADAVVLFDGTSLARWMGADSAPARWRLVDGAFEVAPGTGTLISREVFGDAQIHVEWMSPAPARGTDQDRGNSGVFLMQRYEVQVLDSYNSATYPDGQAGALYGQYPPLVNASRPPGEWQSFDIVFRRPRFDAAGRVTSPACFTIFHNGVLIHDNAELVGPTSHTQRAPYEAHEDRLPISLQDHGHTVRFRNIWVRRLE